MWYERINEFMESLVFTKSKVDSNLYFKVEDNKSVILLLYVDDFLLTGDEKLITEMKKRLVEKFEIK